MSSQRYPLSWPQSWKRTDRYKRKPAAFRSRGGQVSMAVALDRLQGEVDRLGARGAIISTNVELRLDGLPRSGQPAPADPGAALYFELKGEPRCLACDRWLRVEDNVAAIAQHIDALRRIDRYGVGTMEQAFAGYAALPPSTEANWWLILGVPREASMDMIDATFKRLAMEAHPDRSGGSHDAMARLSAAREAARKERGQHA